LPIQQLPIVFARGKEAAKQWLPAKQSNIQEYLPEKN
jgi:hypothetical protein